ncbi:MAG: helix-turn-helix domain-containing protein [Planctomycetota bacterium]
MPRGARPGRQGLQPRSDQGARRVSLARQRARAAQRRRADALHGAQRPGAAHRRFERQLLADALEATGGNQKDAAEAVGLTYDQFRHLLRKYDLKAK